MTDQETTAHGPVPVHYHQFHISDLEGPAGPDLSGAGNGLVEVEDGVVHVLTGIHTGDVEVDITLHAAAPAPQLDAWDEAVEISLNSASGELVVHAMMADLEEEFPALSFNGPGDYRIRVHARGRDTAVDLAPDESTEWYLLQVWPDKPSAVDVLKATDQYGADQRAS
jgi:hypothetical protein